MKRLTVILCLLAATETFGQDQREMHFAAETERACRKEVLALGCGTPTRENAGAFMACVDSKVTSLSRDCQEFHLNVMRMRANHKH